MLDQNRQARLNWQRYDNIYGEPDKFGCVSFCADGDGFVAVEKWDGKNQDDDGIVVEAGYWIVDQGDRVLGCPEEFTEQQALNWAEHYLFLMYREIFDHWAMSLGIVARTEDGYILYQLPSGEWSDGDMTFEELPEGSQILSYD